MNQGHSKWGHGNGTGRSESKSKVEGASKKMGEAPPTEHAAGNKVENGQK